MDFLKTVTGKVVGGLVGLAVVMTGISWCGWTFPPRRAAIGHGQDISWLGVVLVVPWATFFVIGWVARMERTRRGAVLVFLYTAGEAALLLWLFEWRLPGSTSWTFFAVGTLVAAVYNVLTCDWIAEKV